MKMVPTNIEISIEAESFSCFGKLVAKLVALTYGKAKRVTIKVPAYSSTPKSCFLFLPFRDLNEAKPIF
jgi:hypothetical protein